MVGRHVRQSLEQQDFPVAMNTASRVSNVIKRKLNVSFNEQTSRKI